jgi:hypothetical protein
VSSESEPMINHLRADACWAPALEPPPKSGVIKSIDTSCTGQCRSKSVVEADDSGGCVALGGYSLGRGSAFSEDRLRIG